MCSCLPNSASGVVGVGACTCGVAFCVGARPARPPVRGVAWRSGEAERLCSTHAAGRADHTAGQAPALTLLGRPGRRAGTVNGGPGRGTPPDDRAGG